MAEVIRMPLLSDTMTEGKIAQWNKSVGDKVKSDDSLADVETDKATMEVIPYVAGTLLYIGVEAGQSAKVNDIIAIIGEAGEDISSLIEAPSNHKATAEVPVVATETQAPVAASNTELVLPKDLTIIRMPLLSDTMTEGKIVTWNKNVGDKVKADDAIADVETDKATMEVVGYAEGTLLYQGVAVGQAAKVNGIIAIIGKEGTDITPYLPTLLAETNAPKTASVAATTVVTEPPVAAPIVASPAGSENHEDGRIKASPLAKQIAREKGIDWHHIN